MSGKRRKHVPLRTCIACQKRRPKRELIRVVRAPDGTLSIDPKGKSPGRGAYLCPNLRCWERALEQRKLERALKCVVSVEDAAALRTAAALLLVEETKVESETRRVAGEPVESLDLLQKGEIVNGTKR